jgi:lysophospholipase L1-like esterase
MGNSITEGWLRQHPDFFTSNHFVGKGIGGQTSGQMLARFRQDVLNLHPAAVVINAGTNDIAENQGAYNEDKTFANIVSMAELAAGSDIRPILTTVLPAAAFPWRPSVKDAATKIISLNKRVRAYAERQGYTYVDYYDSMVYGPTKALNPSYTKDGVHPLPAGYTVMEKLVLQAINNE